MELQREYFKTKGWKISPNFPEGYEVYISENIPEFLQFHSSILPEWVTFTGIFERISD